MWNAFDLLVAGVVLLIMFLGTIFWGPILMNVCGILHYMAWMRGHRKMGEEQGDGGSEKRYRHGGLLAIEWNGQIDQRWWLAMKVPIPNFSVIQTIMRTLDIEWVWYVDWCCHFVGYVLACWISWECWLMMRVWDLQYIKAWLRGCQKTREGGKIGSAKGLELVMLIMMISLMMMMMIKEMVIMKWYLSCI